MAGGQGAMPTYFWLDARARGLAKAIRATKNELETRHDLSAEPNNPEDSSPYSSYFNRSVLSVHLGTVRCSYLTDNYPDVERIQFVEKNRRIRNPVGRNVGTRDE